jgi:hypothetical protein
MGNPHHHGAHMMHGGRYRTVEEILGICTVCGCVTEALHSDTISYRQNSAQGPAWEEASFEVCPCIWMLGFHARSQTETKEAGLPSDFWHIPWVQHMD